jgi:chemotaxis protein CheD
MRSQLAEKEVPELREYYLRPGFIFVSKQPSLISTVLGSCVAVCLRDNLREFGGMNHFLFPVVEDPERATAKYGNIATNALVRSFLKLGSDPGDLEAQIFGGALLADGMNSAAEVSYANVAMARHVLQRCGVRVVSEDVGGNKGRKLIYNSYTNQVMVIRVEKIRSGDWYPYRGSR